MFVAAESTFVSRASGQARPSRRALRVVSLLAGVIMLLVGVGFVIYPILSSARAQEETSEALAAWRSEVVVADRAQGEMTDETADYRPKEGDDTYEQLLAYNDEVRNGTGDAVNDPFAFASDDLAALGLPDGIVGSVTIARLGETIPLYLGASQQNLDRGAAVLAGTSMPTGGDGTQCVIAAHRGPRVGLSMFRDIETLEIGDAVVIETPWDTLTYQVVGFDVIDPNDTGALAVEPGRDMVTLLTCHPYGHNYQRYLVRCERSDDAAELAPSPAEAVAATVTHAIWPGWSEGSPLLNLENILRLAGLLIVLGLGVWALVSVARRGSHRSMGGAHFD